MEIRPLRENELELAWELDRESFHVPPERRERFLRLQEPERTIGAFEEGRLVAMVGAYAFGQYFGGRSVPMAGITSMAVASDRRGGGLAAELLHGAIRDALARGECISSLFPATTSLYRRAGYEVAGRFGWRKLAPERLRALPRVDGVRLRPADLARDAAAIRACYGRVAATVNGFLERSDRWWEQCLASWSAPGVFVAQSDTGGLEGYVAFRTRGGEYSDLGGPFGIVVDECVAEGRGAALALWGLVGSWSTQADHVLLRGDGEDSLLLLLPEQSLETLVELCWMTRVVDAPRAVAARGFPVGLSIEVSFALRDDIVPENAGSWTLVVENGRASLQRSGEAGLGLDVGAFSALYTGWGSCAALSRAGRLQGGTADQRAALDAAFAGPTPRLTEEF